MSCFPRGLAHDLSGAKALHIHCNACGWEGQIPSEAALKRFGENAAPYDVERKLRCPVCGRSEMSAYVAAGVAAEAAPPFRGQVGHPEGLTLAACSGNRMMIVGVCSPCGERQLEPDEKKPAHRRWWTRRLKLLFDEGRLKCGSCRKPLWGLRIDTGRTGLGPGATVALWVRETRSARTTAVTPQPWAALEQSPAGSPKAAAGARRLPKTPR